MRVKRVYKFLAIQQGEIEIGQNRVNRIKGQVDEGFQGIGILVAGKTSAFGRSPLYRLEEYKP